MKKVQWFGVGVREAYGYTWTNGAVVPVEDDEQADDLLTQPGENFVEVTDEGLITTEIPPATTEEMEALYTAPDSDIGLARRIDGIGPAREKELAEAGIVRVRDLAEMTPAEVDDLVEQVGSLSREQVKGWIEQAKGLLESDDE
jgi:hypothetical protein